MKEPVVGAVPEELRELQPAVRALAETLGEVLARLTRALEAEGRCWGTDESGASFEASYLPASQQVRSLLDGAEAGIEEVAAVLGAAITILETAESDGRRVLA